MSKRHSYSLSNRHDKILHAISKKLDITYVNTVERALESLEEREALRDNLVNAKELK